MSLDQVTWRGHIWRWLNEPVVPLEKIVTEQDEGFIEMPLAKYDEMLKEIEILGKKIDESIAECQP